MKAKTLLLCAVVAAVAGSAGWFAARPPGGGDKPAASGERRVLYYQSPMHPWITAEKPGRCTICGMKLEPVYEGERGFAMAEGLVTLGSNSVQVIHVQSEVVTNRPLVRTLRVAGTIDDDDTKHRRLSAYADGRIEKLFVNFVGAEVMAGQPLAQFYSPALLAAESEYLTVVKQRTEPGLTANLQGERQRLLEAAAQRLRRLGYSDAQIGALAGADTVAARTEILAPMTGTVVARNVYEGQYVKEGELLFELADFGTMWFQFDAYERDLGWLKAGQMVEVTTPALPGTVLTAPITFIDPNLNEMTRSAKVRVELPNPMVDEDGRKHRRLYHRTYADGAVKLQSPAVLAVPRSAVLSAGQPLVYVERGPGAYEPRRVKLGRRGDDDWEILAGLEAGERVVTTGNLLLDAQAQLDASVSVGARTAESARTNLAPLVAPSPDPLTETQQQTAREFLALASELGSALSGDSLARFNEQAPRVHAHIPKLLDALGGVMALRPALQKLEAGGHLEPALDLAAARQEFLPFTLAAAELALQLRASEPFKAVKVFQCPMVDRAIPGAAKNGRWLQLAPPLRNPFFGAQMLECGSEVKVP